MSARLQLRLVVHLLLVALFALPAAPVLARLLADGAGLTLAADVCSVAGSADGGAPAPLQHAAGHCPLCGIHGGPLPPRATPLPGPGLASGASFSLPATLARRDARDMRPEARAPPSRTGKIA